MKWERIKLLKKTRRVRLIITAGRPTTTHLHQHNERSDDDDPATAAAALLPKHYPHFRGKPMYGGNQEALAWALDLMGRSIGFISAGAFLATALLKLAKEAAGCETEPPPGETKVPDCNNRIYGIRPSSLLTTYTIVIGVFSSILMPLMGAVVDYTSLRLKIGRISTVIWCVALFPSIFIGSKTWFPIAILTVIISLVGWVQTIVTYAYLPELTKDRELLNKYTSNYTVIQYSTMVSFLGMIVGLSAAFGITDDDINTARMAQAFAFVLSSITLFYSWMFLFKPRPAAHVLPEGKSVWTAGFHQTIQTSKRIFRDFHALKWFYISIAFADAAIHSLATIAITYLTDQLDFSTFENGIAILCMLLGAIPGGVLAGWSTTKLKSPIYSSLIAILIMFVNTFVAGFTLKEAGQQLETYIIAVFWGVGTGWKWTTDRLLSSTLIPEGQDAELMGYFLFAGQILTWIPPLIFTGLNELGVPQRYGIMMLNSFFLVAGVAYLRMGSYHEAVRVAGRTQHVGDVVVVASSDDESTEESAVAAHDYDRRRNDIGVEEASAPREEKPSVAH
jgi:UMF1 family MFS transporter